MAEESINKPCSPHVSNLPSKCYPRWLTCYDMNSLWAILARFRCGPVLLREHYISVASFIAFRSSSLLKSPSQITPNRCHPKALQWIVAICMQPWPVSRDYLGYEKQNCHPIKNSHEAHEFHFLLTVLPETYSQPPFQLIPLENYAGLQSVGVALRAIAHYGCFGWVRHSG